jgi:hypothetical protein
LYLINSEKFSTKRQLIDALKNTDYDMDLFHFVKAYAESEVRELKTKRDGGKLLVICWRGRGLSVLLEWRLENRQAQLASRGKPALERKLCR